MVDAPTLLARGGMAELWRTTREDGAPCVIKQLRASVRDDPDARRMLAEEGRLMMRLAHPNIVRVLDVLADGRLVLEHLVGLDAGAAIDLARQHGLEASAAVAAAISAQVATALAFAHDGPAGPVVHRDVNPPNVFIAPNGLVKLLDFGVARADVERDATASGVVKGKEPYLAPEQLTGGTPRPATDVYALGAAHHALRTGRPPISDWFEVVARVRGGALELDPRLDAGEADFVQRAMAIEPDARPTAAECAHRAWALAGDPQAAMEALAGWIGALLSMRERVRSVDDLMDFDAFSHE